MCLKLGWGPFQGEVMATPCQFNWKRLITRVDLHFQLDMRAAALTHSLNSYKPLTAHIYSWNQPTIKGNVVLSTVYNSFLTNCEIIRNQCDKKKNSWFEDYLTEKKMWEIIFPVQTVTWFCTNFAQIWVCLVVKVCISDKLIYSWIKNIVFNQSCAITHFQLHLSINNAL